jgi:hypothetical protein
MAPTASIMASECAMTTNPPLKTQQRYAFLTLAIIAQVILLAILIPATRSEALAFALELLGMLINLVIGMVVYGIIAQKRSLVGGAMLYTFVAFVLLALEMILLIPFQLRKSSVAFSIGLFSPLIVSMMLWIMQRREQPTNAQKESDTREKLRNRNGV